jgi:hypothetical protein
MRGVVIRVSVAGVRGSDLWPHRSMDQREAVKTLLRP